MNTLRLILLGAVAAALCVIPVTSRAQIFVTNSGNNTICEYNATTGATINSSFISSGLDGPDRFVVVSTVTWSASPASGDWNKTTTNKEEQL